jgi:DNA helicase-2/ATP-dependent DNA helicase PcrA
MKLNDAQEQAANHTDGPCLVIAVPGSGKTRLLVERVGRLTERGVNPGNIVCVTFTNKAADEMKDRICKRLAVAKPKLFVGTFHRLCVELIRKFGDRIGYTSKFTIIDSDDQKDIIRQIARQLEKPLEKNEVPIIAKAVNDFRENMSGRDELDDNLQNKEDWVHIADEYIDRLKKDNCIDFSGLLAEAIRLLESHQDIRERVQAAFKYVQVDEVQDTNYSQFHLINLFTAKWNNVLMVGDISQSIYKFRGARYKNIQDFLARHNDCVKIELSLNYRSTPQIVKAADTLIRHNTSHMAERFEAVNGDGESIQVLHFPNQFEEADFVARHIDKLIHTGGWDAKDIAILYRMNSMSEPVERSLANKSILYKVIGGKSFYDRREIKDSLAILRFISNPRDGIAFHRIAALVDGVGDVTVGKIEKIAQHENMPIIEACHRFKDGMKLGKVRSCIDNMVEKLEIDTSNLNVHDALVAVIDKFGYEEFLKKEYGDDGAFERMDNIRALLQSAGKFATEHPENSIDRFLQMVTLLSGNDEKNDENRVSMMSIHGAKGLEFPVVFMVGVEQNVLPHGLAVEEDPIEGLEEERRLCYVGMTRAKELLLMSHNRNRRMFGTGGAMYNKPAKPSQFLMEAGLVKQHEKLRL